MSFYEQNSNNNLPGERLIRFALALLLLHSMWQKKIFMTRTPENQSEHDSQLILVFLSFAILLKKSLLKAQCKRQKFQTSLSFHKCYFLVYPTLFHKDVSLSLSLSKNHSILYFFTDIDLLKNSPWQICYLMTKIFLDNFFILIEFLSFELIFNSEKDLQ